MKSKFTGKAKIYRKDFDGRPSYSASISQKNVNDEWESAFIKVQFNRGVELADRTEIEVNNGWLKFYLNKDGKPVWVIHINDYILLNEPRVDGLDEDAFNEALDEIPF